jgi:hypothetical protein
MPRLSIGRLMVLVAIVAANCWVVRNLLGLEWNSSFGFANSDLDIPLVPMATILAVGFVLVPRARARRPGFIGFQATGWAVLLVYVGFCVMAPEWTYNVLYRTFVIFWTPVLRYFWVPVFHYLSIDRGALHSYEELLLIILAIPLSTLPQLLVALLGGFLAHRFAKGVRCRP